MFLDNQSQHKENDFMIPENYRNKLCFKIYLNEKLLF